MIRHLFFCARVAPWLLTLLLPAAALAEVSSSAAQPIDRIVAVVNEDVITQTELEEQMRLVAQQLRGQNTAPPPAAVLQRQVLERIVLARLQLQLAQNFGIQVDDTTLNRALENIAAQNKMSLREFRDVLERDGYRFERFREDIRREIIVSRLRQREVDNRVIVTDQEVDNLLATQAAQGGAEDDYHLSHILLAVPEGASPEQIAAVQREAEALLERLRAGADFSELAISRSDGQQALQGGDLGWRKLAQLPTLFADAVPRMQVGQVSTPIRSPSGFHLIRLNDRRGQATERNVVAQTHVRHILIRPNEVTTASEARLRLERLRERIEGGEDFAELARAHSDDRASATKGGDLGWVSPGEMVADFDRAVAEVPKGAVSSPFRTDFGWHIAQVLDRRDFDNTEEYQRTRAREDVRQRKIEEEYQIWLRRLRDESFVEYRS